jgi:hypothetical protein
MATCAVRRGFFVLRDCGEPAGNVCSECARPICPEHTVMADTVLCVECSGRHREQTEDEDWYNGSGAYAYRHQYYSRHHYGPVYTGTHHDGYYDNYDVRSFDDQDTGTFGDEGDTGAGLLDS